MSEQTRGGNAVRRDDSGLVMVLAFGGIVVSLSQTLVIPLLGVLPAILGTTAVNASWVVTITLLAGAVVIEIAKKFPVPTAFAGAAGEPDELGRHGAQAFAVLGAAGRGVVQGGESLGDRAVQGQDGLSYSHCPASRYQTI